MTLAHRRTPRARRSARLLAALLTVGALSAGGALVATAPATAASTYAVRGSISYAVPGSTAPTTRVRLYPVTGSQPASGGAYTTTSSGGSWSVSGVAPGKYRILFEATSSDNKANAPVWYGGTSFEDSAQVVTVGSSDVTGLAVTQPAAGTISGTISGSFDAPALQAYLLNPATGLFERAVGLGSANTNGTGNYTIRGLAAGQYVVRFADRKADLPAFSTQYYKDATSLWDSQTVTVSAGQQVTGIDGAVSSWGWYSGRIAGTDRFATSAAVSAAIYTGGTTAGSGPVVHVANGLNFPDALSASAASAAVGGPLLLTRQGSIPAPILTELQRLKPSEIVVVGGTGSVDAATYTQLSKLAGSIRRVSGLDRYATSRAVVDDFPAESATSVFVATGANFPDALVAGSAAGYQYGPLLLVNGSAAHLDAASAASITRLSPSRIYVIGGLGSISTGIQADLEKLGAPQVLRLAGTDRYATAQAVNAAVFPFADDAFVASSLGFADALSISAAAGMLGSPLLLARPTCIPYGEVADATLRGVSTYWAIGGTGSLADSVTDLTVCPGGAATTGETSTLSEVQPTPAPADEGGLRSPDGEKERHTAG